MILKTNIEHYVVIKKKNTHNLPLDFQKTKFLKSNQKPAKDKVQYSKLFW